jgi:hypothetical protein
MIDWAAAAAYSLVASMFIIIERSSIKRDKDVIVILIAI